MEYEKGSKDRIYFLVDVIKKILPTHMSIGIGGAVAITVIAAVIIIMILTYRITG